MQQQGFKFDKKQNFPKTNYLDNLHKNELSLIMFSTFFFFFCTESVILAFIHLCNQH